MTTTATEEQEILVRGSAEYKDYMRHRAGWLKALVNGLEDYLAISGRSLLLIFLIYTTVKAGIAMMHVNAPIWLEVLMLSLQVAGVEGAVLGLARHKEVLVSQGREKDARTIGRAINSTRTLAILTGLEIALSLTPTLGGFDMAPVNDAYSKVLLIARLVVISNFLIAMARMEKQGPKIISQAEHERQQNAQEQEQIRMDNAAIHEAINQALTHWTQQQEQRLDTLSTRHQSLDPLSTDLSRLVQHVDHLDSLDTRLTQVEESQGEQWSRLEQSIQATLRGTQTSGRVSRQKKEQAPLSRQARSITRPLDTQKVDSLDPQERKPRLDSQQTEKCLDTPERRDPLSRPGSPTGKIIPLSRHGKSPSKQSHMTERILEFIRINHREPSLGEIQSWGCARQTAVNSREAARAILRREVASQESAALEHEGTHQ